MKRILKSWLLATAVAFVTASAVAEVLTDQDFRTVIRTAGVWPTITGNNKSGSQNNAFDGVRFSDSSSKRWLSSFKTYGTFGDEGKDGVYAQMLAPNVFR